MGESWYSKYAPSTLDEMVVAPEKKQKLYRIIQDLPNTILHGTQGTGKSTFMSILIKESSADPLTINASNENGIDVIRYRVEKYARSLSLDRQRKIVYFEEADNLTEDAQNALKYLMDQVHDITKFFFVCNNSDNIIDPIKSRCTYVLHLEDPPKKQIHRYIHDILNLEEIRLKNPEDIDKVIDCYYPDLRSIVGHLQSNINDDRLKIDETILDTLIERKKLTADQKRKSDRIRARKWHEKQQQQGKKQISCVISKESYDILHELEGSYGKIIDELILDYYYYNKK